MNVKARPVSTDSKLPAKKVKKERTKEASKPVKDNRKPKNESVKPKKEKKRVETKKPKKVIPPEKIKRKSATVKKQDLANLVETIMVSSNRFDLI